MADQQDTDEQQNRPKRQLSRSLKGREHDEYLKGQKAQDGSVDGTPQQKRKKLAAHVDNSIEKDSNEPQPAPWLSLFQAMLDKSNKCKWLLTRFPLSSLG